MYKLISIEEAPAITVARAKERLRIYTSDDDNDIQALINSAVKVVEQETGRKIAKSTWDYIGNEFPICLDGTPFREIVGIYYNDADEVEQTIDPSNYYFIETSTGAEIFYITGFYPPITSIRSASVRARFTAGYSSAFVTGEDLALSMPPQIELAVLFLVGNWYENREPMSVDQQFKVPKTFEHIVSQLKVYR